MKRFGVFLLALLVLTPAAGCSHQPEGPVDLAGTSARFTVQGRYQPIALENVTAVSIDNGKLVVHGDPKSQVLDLPAGADGSKPMADWSLTNENDAGPKHSISFTNAQSLDVFTIELPPGTADLHYGTLQARGGGAEVMLFAWGANSRCYWGYLTITPKA